MAIALIEYPEQRGPYRYSLQLSGLDLQGKDDHGEVVFVMRNPATEENVSEDRDHTTRNICCGIAQRLGYGAVTEINLFGYRAKDLSTLRDAYCAKCDIVGGKNDRAINEVVSRAALVIVAWGRAYGRLVFRQKYDRRVKKVRSLIEPLGKTLYCLTKKNVDSSNFPPHPIGSLQVNTMKDLTPWPQRR